MKLYHLAGNRCVNDIFKSGLTYKKKDVGYEHDTGAINNVLKKYRPEYLPEFVDRDKCIFFHVEEQDFDGGICFEVDTKVLDLDKLYIADYELAHRIWIDVVDAPYSGEYSGIPLYKTSKDYWKTMIPYKEYIESPEKSKYTQVEALYFGEIKSKYLNVFEKQHEIFKEILELLEHDYNLEIRGNCSAVINNEIGIIEITYSRKCNRILVGFSARIKKNEATRKIVDDILEKIKSRFNIENTYEKRNGHVIVFEQVSINNTILKNMFLTRTNIVYFEL